MLSVSCRAKTCVELLRHRHETDCALVEPVYQSREIEKRPAQASTLYTDAIYRRASISRAVAAELAVEISAGETAVVIMSGEQVQPRCFWLLI